MKKLSLKKTLIGIIIIIVVLGGLIFILRNVPIIKDNIMPLIDEDAKFKAEAKVSYEGALEMYQHNLERFRQEGYADDIINGSPNLLEENGYEIRIYKQYYGKTYNTLELKSYEEYEKEYVEMCRKIKENPDEYKSLQEQMNKQNHIN